MKEGRPVRALLLDVTGTLLTFRCPMGVTYRNCAEAVGLTPLPKAEDLQSSFSSAFRQQWQRFPCYGAHHGVSEEAWWKETARQTLLSSLPLPSPPVKDRQMAHFLEEVYSFYGREEAYTLFEDATSLLDFAHRHGLKVGVLTNSSKRTVDLLEPFGLLDKVQVALSCQQIGHAKPSKQAFDHLFERLSVLPGAEGLLREEVLHVGDHGEEDFEGAIRAGFNAVLVDRSSGVAQGADDANGEAWEGEGSVSSLRQVQRFLQRQRAV
eukprot:gene7770-8581_t